MEETIYVTGHKSPDADTVGSAIAYAALLQALGHDAIPVILGAVNPETAFILSAAGMETPGLLKDASGKKMILVDHSEYIQSAEGLGNAQVLGIVDHHENGDVTPGNPLVYDVRPLGSTATVIWIQYRNHGVEPDRKTATVMLGAILSDTKNLRSGTTTSMDREAIRALSSIAGVSEPDAFYQEMYRASLSYDGMTDEQIFFSDYREYESGGTKYAIGCINAYDEDGAAELAKRMKRAIPYLPASTGTDMAFAKITILRDGKSVALLVPSDDAAGEILEAAFGEKAAFDGTAYRLEPNISRKQILVPAIRGILESHPNK